MAQPTNTFDSYDAVGARESLSDKINNIDPYDTPFFSNCATESISAHYHEFQTDALRPAARNKHIQGDDTTATAKVATVRLGNYSQTIKDAVSIPDTDDSTDKAGRKRELIYQQMKMGKELRTDLEMALFSNYAKAAGSSTGAAEMAGALAWIHTNTSVAVAGSPAEPEGDGTDGRTDGTQLAFSQARLDTVMQSCWTEGGKPTTVYLSAFQQDIASGFTGSNNQRSTIDASKAKNAVIKSMDIYISPFGKLEMQLSRFNRARDVLVLQDDMWAVGVKRSWKSTELAKTGDATKMQIVGEYTLISKNEKASGLVADNTTA
jgi:hypothetical protein